MISPALAIGASTTIGTYLLPELLGQYRQRYPDIELFLDIANAEEIQQRVVAREVEIDVVERISRAAQEFLAILEQQS